MRKALFAGLFLLLSVSIFAQHIESDVFAADANSKGFTLNKNSGSRIYTLEIRFDKPFETLPNVVCAITGLDADSETNVRVDVAATAVSRDGFVLRVKTWGDTKIYGVVGSWIAHN